MAATAALTAGAMAVGAASSAMSASQNNAQIAYQQAVLAENARAAQNQAAAEMKKRREDAVRAQATTRAQMASTGVASTSGSFLDLIGEGAANAQMDVLKAKYDGDAQAWSINQSIAELETQKKNVGLEAGLAGAQAGLSTAASMGAGGAIGSGLSKAGTKIKKTVQKLTTGPVGDFTNNMAQEFK